MLPSDTTVSDIVMVLYDDFQLDTPPQIPRQFSYFQKNKYQTDLCASASPDFHKYSFHIPFWPACVPFLYLRIELLQVTYDILPTLYHIFSRGELCDFFDGHNIKISFLYNKYKKEISGCQTEKFIVLKSVKICWLGEKSRYNRRNWLTDRKKVLWKHHKKWKLILYNFAKINYRKK